MRAVSDADGHTAESGRSADVALIPLVAGEDRQAAQIAGRAQRGFAVAIDATGVPEALAVAGGGFGQRLHVYIRCELHYSIVAVIATLSRKVAIIATHVADMTDLKAEIIAFLAWMRQSPHQVCLASDGCAGELVEYGDDERLISEYLASRATLPESAAPKAAGPTELTPEMINVGRAALVNGTRGLVS